MSWGVRVKDHVKPVIIRHFPARMADIGLYMWSEVGHSENILELWCLQSSFLTGDAFRIKNPRAGSLNSLTRCRSLKEESCQAKTVKEEWRERVRVRENWWLLISWVQSLRSLYFSDSCVLDSQNHFNESPFSLKPVGVGLLSILVQTWF